MNTATLAQICESLGAALVAGPWPALKVKVGAKWLSNLEDPLPRMVFVLPRPGEETFEAPDQVGSRAGHRPRAVRTRVAPLEVHCGAVTLEDTERLAHDLASEIHRQLYGVYALLGGGYLSENESAWAQYGEVYVLRFSVRQPILETPMGVTPSVATVETVAPKTVIVDPATGAEETDLDYPPDP